MKLASLLLRFSQLATSIVILALGIHLTTIYDANYYSKHSMPTSARYGAWSGGFGILIAGVGMVLTIIGRAHAILTIVLDVLAAIFFLVCGCALIPLVASYNGDGHWACDIDETPAVCTKIRTESRWDLAIAFLAFLDTAGLLILAFAERRKIRSPSSSERS